MSELVRRRRSVSEAAGQLELLGDERAAGEASFRALFESAPDAIFVEDLEGTVLDVNPAGCRLHRMAREKLIGLNVEDLVPPAERAASIEKFKALVAGKIHQVEGFSYTADGEAIPVSVRASHLRYRGKHALLFHVSDLTEQRVLQEQLRQSQKMEAIGRLAGGIAHDFNNLLTAILGYSDLCASVLGADHEVYKDMIEVQNAGEQAAKLTRQLLAYSRQQVLAPRVLDLNEVVENMERLCVRTIGEDVKLVTRLSPALKKVRVDEGQLEQVILNLNLNSRDAMPEGGEISIATENVFLEDESLREHVAVSPGHYVSLTVSDSGCGMSPEVKSRAFDPFFTTKEPDKGTGLGLSTVYGIIKQSGGYIWVESEIDRGTHVEILLPATEERIQQAPVLPPVEELCAGDKTILLTEDNRIVRELSKKILEEKGYRVWAVETAEEALSICNDNQEQIDLLVTDLVLTGLDGLSMTRQILESRPGTRALLMSGHSKEARFNPDALIEGTSFLQKPFTPAGLERAVAGALQEPAPVSS
ncbi:MAG: ATP-binding protein [Thermoanaerobaculia bacterium]